MVTIAWIRIATTSRITDIIRSEERFYTADRYEKMKNKKIKIMLNPKIIKIFFEIWLLSIFLFSEYAN